MDFMWIIILSQIITVLGIDGEKQVRANESFSFQWGH